MTVNQNTPLPGLCQSVVGAAPDFVGSSAVVYDLAGRAWIVALGLNQASWVSAGSPAGQRRWAFVDLTS
jgi:hypothetical protein